jgi:hypothetical protein
MVAITVILAAVIGAFVLEIGDQQETAPKTSMTMDERMVFLDFDAGAPSDGINTTQVAVLNGGGETLPIDQTELVVGGHRDTWGVSPNPDALEKADGTIDTAIDTAPQPDWRRTLGTNEQVTFGAGEAWNVIAYDVQRQVDSDGDGTADTVQKSLHEPAAYDSIPKTGKAGHDYYLVHAFDTSTFAGSKPYSYQCTCTVLYFIKDGTHNGHYGWGPQLDNGDTVDVVWTSASGGKSQVLRSYEVNHDETGEDIWK